MRETSVEKRLIRETRKMGGICWKIMPVVAGMPDRLVMLPDNWVELVETKAPGGTLRPAQRVQISRVRPLGVRVTVLQDIPAVVAWAAERADRVSERAALAQVHGLAQTHRDVIEDQFSQAILDVIAKTSP